MKNNETVVQIKKRKKLRTLKATLAALALASAVSTNSNVEIIEKPVYELKEIHLYEKNEKSFIDMKFFGEAKNANTTYSIDKTRKIMLAGIFKRADQMYNVNELENIEDRIKLYEALNKVAKSKKIEKNTIKNQALNAKAL